MNKDEKLYVIPFYEGNIIISYNSYTSWILSFYIYIRFTLDHSFYFWRKGLQRVVLFTEDQRVFSVLLDNESLRHSEQEIILSLQNMGISLVNNTTSQEISFIGIRWCVDSSLYDKGLITGEICSINVFFFLNLSMLCPV